MVSYREGTDIRGPGELPSLPSSLRSGPGACAQALDTLIAEAGGREQESVGWGGGLGSHAFFCLSNTRTQWPLVRL